MKSVFLIIELFGFKSEDNSIFSKPNYKKKFLAPAVLLLVRSETPQGGICADRPSIAATV
jgi:hypothetical protein